MDDLYEKPTSTAPISSTDTPEDAGQLSDEDDGGPDWTRLSALASSAPSKPVLAIPKRGDKEFEPAGGIDAGGVGTNLQQHKLERTRAAMFGALDVERTVSSKIASYSVWCPEVSRARMLNARGIFFSTMGYNVPIDARISPSVKKEEKGHTGKGKVVELLPEEALYLIERGSMFCWSQISGEASDEGTPMTVQQAYSEMVGKEDLTLERYQVYAYLKRLGYTVSRARSPDPYYITAPPFVSRPGENPELGVLRHIAGVFASPFGWLFGPRAVKADWWRPLQVGGFIHRFFSYTSLFSSLRLLPSGYSRPLSPSSAGQASPYEIFYHLYKPSTPYRKTSPPPPDFFVIVVDGRKTPMPTIHELCALFEQLPELPPPVPRRRLWQGQQARAPPKSVNSTPRDVTPAYPMSLYGRIQSFFRRIFRLGKVVDGEASTLVAPPRRPNPFQLLKNGKKMIVVAAVDAGMISFFRFCQGAFDEWPMI